MRSEALGVALAALNACASAADYPTKPIRMVAAQAAVGNADIVARAIAKKMGDALKQQFVMENKRSLVSAKTNISWNVRWSTVVKATGMRAG